MNCWEIEMEELIEAGRNVVAEYITPNKAEP